MLSTHLFIDTNVFLKFYHYSKDDLSQLRALIENLKAGNVTLHLPQQVLNELERNRERVLKDSADIFKKESCPTQIPRHMLDYAQAKEYADAVQIAIRARNSMINQASSEAANHTLLADKLMIELKEKANVYPERANIFARAKERAEKGNPPGKPGSMGDQYNWEYLLENVPPGDLHIVSKDGDFASILDSNMPRPFLQKEWLQQKKGALHIYSEIRPFLIKHASTVNGESNVVEYADPDADFMHPTNEEMVLVHQEIAHAFAEEKNKAIEKLVNSERFIDTHIAIDKLEEFRTALTKEDVERLFRAAFSNNQILWIASDADVYSFFKALLEEDEHEIDNALVDTAVQVFGLGPAPEDQDPYQD
ncbi:PIN domain-containing protein [Massilia pseudoviolaceinigra]|uniref:PIN domain-containing protein n=1 Tax=Massilia pseudoviolaceinigra TaxID=3057165 RepID=UPI0027969236|nr:PIN domain-containing protein [Massilia sp. CCM 9206]MDQ1924654.1 PIN domain-containing protein [Massilia sp. CCM 9206]